LFVLTVAAMMTRPDGLLWNPGVRAYQEPGGRAPRVAPD
jgi:hypothetical protein